MRLCQKDKTAGFTLIETILALSILAVVAALFPLWIRAMDDPTTVDFEHKKGGIGVFDPMEVQLFFQEAGMEIRGSSEVEAKGTKLALTKTYGDEDVTFQLYKGNQIRRQVKGKGHEVMLYGVEGCKFEASGKGVKVTVKGPGGHQYERFFLPLSPEKE